MVRYYAVCVALVATTLALAGPGCIWEDHCTAGATRMDGECVLLTDGATVDAGSSDGSSDGDADAGRLPDGCALTVFYRDSDEDGWGDADVSMAACVAPEGFTDRAGDCNDAAEAVSPDADETCNGLDDDCDGRIDEGLLVPATAADGVALGDADTGTGLAVSLAAFSAGYVAVWERDDDRIVYELLDSSGGSLIGTPMPLEAALADAQQAPSVAVLSEVSPPVAVIAYLRGDTLRSRTVPLDGTSPRDAVTIDASSSIARPIVIGAGAEAVVTWIDQSDGPRVRAARVDGASGAVIGSPETVYQFVNPPLLLFHWAALSRAADGCLLLGVSDRRSGDLLPTGYVTCIPYPALGTGPIGSVMPSTARSVLMTTPVVDREGNDLALLLSGSGADYELAAGALHVDDASIRASEPLHGIDPGGVPSGWAPADRGGLLLYVDSELLSGPSGSVHGAFVDSDGAADGVRTWFAVEHGIEGLAIASDRARSALLTAIPIADGSASAPVVFRQLGCE